MRESRCVKPEAKGGHRLGEDISLSRTRMWGSGGGFQGPQHARSRGGVHNAALSTDGDRMNEESSPQRFRVHPGLALTALVAIAVFGWVALPPATLGPVSDPTHYAVLAGYYSESLRGTAEPYLEYIYRASRFPPVWPAVLGLLGGGPGTPGLLKAVTSLCAVAVVLLTWAWVRRETRDPWLATLLGMTLALNPGFFIVNLEPHSEALGMVLMLGALLVAAQSPREGANTHRAAALLAMLALTRAIGLVFAPALAIWILRARGGLRAAVSAASVVGLPLCLWLLFRTTIPNNVAYPALLNPERDLAGVGGWLGFLLSQPLRLAENLAACLAPVGGGASQFAAFVLCGLALVGWVQRLFANRLDAWLLGGYLGVLFVWPFPNEIDRFLVFVLPLVLVCAVTAATAFGSRVGQARERWVGGGLLLLLALASGPSIVQGASRALLQIDPELASEKRGEEFFRAPSDEEAAAVAEHNARKRLTAQSLREVVPKGQCVYAVQVTYAFAHGGVPAVEFPPDFLEGVAGADTLRLCQHFYVVGGKFVGDGAPAIDFFSALRGVTRPVLVSTQETPAGTVVVAAVLERLPAAPDNPGRETP